MGWLRDFMLEASPPVRSFGALARVALKAPNWPVDSQQQERSLAAIFSKLDRQLEVDWLADRVGVQRVLAEVLGRPMADLRQAVSSEATPRPMARRRALQDAPYARALDLLDEVLPPGMPEEVLDPKRWSRLWWYAPSSSGRSLVGKWLEMRGLARFIVARDFGSAMAALPRRGPVFLEVATPPEPGQSLSPLLTDRLCVAAPVRLESISWQGAGGPTAPKVVGFDEVSSPKVDTILEELLRWLLPRLPDDTRFDIEGALAWLRGEPRRKGLLNSFGSVVGLCGLYEELGEQGVKDRSVFELAELYFRRQVEQFTDPESETGRVLLKRGPHIMLSMIERAFIDSRLGWDAPRSLDEWLELVPEDEQRSVDLNWLRLSLSGGDSPLRPKDIDRAARRLPPGAFRIVRALKQTNMLRPFIESGTSSETECLVLGPRWFGCCLEREAVARVVERSPLEWGEACLVPERAHRVFTQLMDQFIAGETAPLEPFAEMEGEDSVGYIAAVQVAFQAAGFALLRGAELSADELSPLWKEQLKWLSQSEDELPQPRLPLSTARAAPEGSVELSSRAFLLAALSVSEQLESEHSGHHLLSPWQSTKKHPKLVAAADQILLLLRNADESLPWVPRVYALIARLRAAVGELERDRIHPLELPGVIVEEVIHEVLTFDTVRGLADIPGAVHALKIIADERNVNVASVIEAIFRTWDRAGRPARGAGFLAAESGHAQTFWSHFPVDLMPHLLAEAPAPIPIWHFGAEQWHAFVQLLKPSGQVAASAEVFRSMPEPIAKQLLSGSGLSACEPAHMAILWHRFSKLLNGTLTRCLKQSRIEDTLLLIEAAPPQTFSDHAELLQGRVRLLDLSPDHLDRVRRWLYRGILERWPGWRSAYDLYHRIEEHVQPLRSQLP